MKHSLLFALFAAPLVASPYKVEDIKFPAEVPPEVGAIDFAPDGTLFAVLRRGDVMRAKPAADPANWKWELFATGFHNGCGIDAVSRNKVRVTQMADSSHLLLAYPEIAKLT